MNQKQNFQTQLEQIVSQKNKNNIYLNREQYEKILQEVKLAKLKNKYKNDLDYRRLKRYDVKVLDGEEKLISPIQPDDDIKLFVTIEETFEIIQKAHLASGHGGRNRLIKDISNKYNNVTTEAVMLYLSLCEECQGKTKAKKNKVGVKPNKLTKSKCLVDILDFPMQPDDGNKFILLYQDVLTKFIILRALKTKTPTEVAKQLLDIFSILGAPCILLSNQGRVFARKITQELSFTSDVIKILHGKSCVNPQNQDIKHILTNWLISNNSSKWSEGLKYVQLIKNRAVHEGLQPKQSPFEALFGARMKLGLKTSDLPIEVVGDLETEEDLERLLENLPEGVIDVKMEPGLLEDEDGSFRVDTEGDWQMKTEDDYISEISVDGTATDVWEPIQEVDNDESHQSPTITPQALPSAANNLQKDCSCCCLKNHHQTETKDEFYHFGQNIACQLRKLPLKSALRVEVAISNMIAKERLMAGKKVTKRRFRTNIRKSKDEEEGATSTSAAVFTAPCSPQEKSQENEEYCSNL